MKFLSRGACSLALLLFSAATYAEAPESEASAIARAGTANRAKDYGTAAVIYRKLTGDGVPRDHTRACDFYVMAEQRGDPMGTELLANCFYKGEGRTQDYAQSAALYTRASARGFPMADCALGNQYLRGFGVEKNPAKAASLCRKSADRGVADAQTDLGQMYLMGEGVERNLPQAASWFQKAVDQGQANAALLLGTMYWNGDGVERNHEQAAKIWHLSAEHGNNAAPARLTKYYFAAAVSPGEQRVLEEPALKAAYWGIVAARIDPDPAARTQSQKLVDMLLGAAPGLKPKVEAMLTNAVLPGF
jgi:TPR repeat protein